MGENITPPPIQPETSPVPEDLVADSAPVAEEGPLIVEKETPTEAEVEAADEARIEDPENIFEELDEDLSDTETATDTVWLLRRVGVGILKVLLLFGALFVIGWFIWGDDQSKNIKNVQRDLPIMMESVKNKIPQPQSIFKTPGKTISEETETFTVADTTSVSRNLVLWNYWLESQRVSNQSGLLPETLLWKKEVETLFEISFPERINGSTVTLRDYQIGRLLERLDQLISRAANLQQRLGGDIADFSAQAEKARQQSIEAEQFFLNALKYSDPVTISQALDQKTEAEKRLQEALIKAEARRIFIEKVGSYALVLENMEMLLTANRAAIAQDIQVVNFPSDPFGRVISPGAWTTPQ